MNEPLSDCTSCSFDEWRCIRLRPENMQIEEPLQAIASKDESAAMYNHGDRRRGQKQFCKWKTMFPQQRRQSDGQHRIEVFAHDDANVS